MTTTESVSKLLLSACVALTPAPDSEVWDYGWGYEPYRRSSSPVMSGPNGPLTLPPAGMDDFEKAVSALLREPAVRARWHPEEFWSVVGSMIARASAEHERETFIDSALDRIRTVGPSLTVLQVANVTWTGEPLVHTRFVLGSADEGLPTALDSVANGRAVPDGERWTKWLAEQVQPRTSGVDAPTPVAFACWTDAQGSLAISHAERSLDDLVGLCLLLEADMPTHRTFMRGPTNRPGVRGLTLDRGAIERALTGSGRLELASFPLQASSIFGHLSQVQWFSAEPASLSDVLRDSQSREMVLSCFESDFLSRTIRLSARWFAEAYFTQAPDDAALALGVALDALLSGEAALGSGAMADRYALLDPDVDVRKERRRAYQKAFAVRSAVAHGGKSSALEDGGFVETYLSMVHGAARRTIAMRDAFTPSSGKALDELYDDLRLGVRTWP